MCMSVYIVVYHNTRIPFSLQNVKAKWAGTLGARHNPQDCSCEALVGGPDTVTDLAIFTVYCDKPAIALIH